MSLINQLRHDLLFKARLSAPEVDTLLAHPELAAEGVTPTAAQGNLQQLLKQSAEASSLRVAIGTFQRDLTRPAGNEVEPPAAAEAATDEQAEQLNSSGE